MPFNLALRYEISKPGRAAKLASLRVTRLPAASSVGSIRLMHVSRLESQKNNE